MKQTRQKNLILENLMNREDHPTAEMVYQDLHKIDEHISLATIYRNLNNFALKGKIRKIELANMKDRFDWKIQVHDHALCMKCGKLEDIESIYPKKKKRILGNFKVSEIDILYKGVCEDCQR